jgi:hypothetical protein
MNTPKDGHSLPTSHTVALDSSLHTSIDLNDILSLTDFQRSAKQHISRLRRSGKAQVLTVNGSASLVVQDAKSYQRLLDEIASLKTQLATRTALVAARVERESPARDDASPEIVVKQSPESLEKPRESKAATTVQTKAASRVTAGIAVSQPAPQATAPRTGKATNLASETERNAASAAPSEQASSAQTATLQSPSNEPASDGLARALAQLRQQLAASKAGSK